MTPLIVLVLTTLICEAIRRFTAYGGEYLVTDIDSLRIGLATLFFLTASAHFGKRRADLVRMTPAWVRKREMAVTLTGLIEIVGAVGLLLPAWAPLAAGLFVPFLFAIFPANVKAAREGLTVGGKKTLGIGPRGLIQLVFIGACAWVATIGRFQ